MEAAFLKHIEKQLPELQGGKLLVNLVGENYSVPHEYQDPMIYMWHTVIFTYEI